MADDALQVLRDNLPAGVEIAYFDTEMLELGGLKKRFTIVQNDPAEWRLEVLDNTDEVIYSGCWHDIYHWMHDRGYLELLSSP
jgi:hypothetical protein